MEKMCETIKKEKPIPIMNILLMGATRLGKSSLITGLLGVTAVAQVGESAR
ncbi:hypothetical protein Taitung79_08880 [Helicobacter pylori]